MGQGALIAARRRTATPPTVTPVIQNPTPKPQVFEIVCTGLKPNSVHFFFYENVDRSQDCVPVYPKSTTAGAITLGAPLITDSAGKIQFNFYFTQLVEAQVDATNKVKYELAGDKKFELRTLDSSASKIVPFQNYSIPNNLNINLNLQGLNLSYQQFNLF